MQSRIESFIESTANIATGMIISYCLGAVIYPVYGFDITPGQNINIVVIFTAVSMARSYTWRRIFNRRSINKYQEKYESNF